MRSIKTIFSGVTINEMALSDQSDFAAFFRLRKMNYWNFIDPEGQQSTVISIP